MWNSQWLQNSLGFYLCSLLLFTHATAAHDTTSSLVLAVKKIKRKTHFQELTTVKNRNASTEEVISAEERALVCTYKEKDSLEAHVETILWDSVTECKLWTCPHGSLDTSCSHVHSMRVYVCNYNRLQFDPRRMGIHSSSYHTRRCTCKKNGFQLFRCLWWLQRR